MPISTMGSNLPAGGNQFINDVVFVIEGTALCGAYLNELKQNYIYPTLECFHGGHFEDRDSPSDSNYSLYGLVVFHSSDILPGSLTDAYGPVTTPQQLLMLIDKIQFSGGHGEAASHIGEGLSTAIQCLKDMETSRLKAPDKSKFRKQVVLICNSKPYGLPVAESVGDDGSLRGFTAEQIAGIMIEKGISLSIFSPRKIPALISLFDRAGGESSSQKTYARDSRHLVLLNGFHLQERPATPIKMELPTPQSSVAAATTSSVQNTAGLPTHSSSASLVPNSIVSASNAPTISQAVSSQPQHIGPPNTPQIVVNSSHIQNVAASTAPMSQTGFTAPNIQGNINANSTPTQIQAMRLRGVRPQGQVQVNQANSGNPQLVSSLTTQRPIMTSQLSQQMSQQQMNNPQLNNTINSGLQQPQNQMNPQQVVAQQQGQAMATSQQIPNSQLHQMGQQFTSPQMNPQLTSNTSAASQQLGVPLNQGQLGLMTSQITKSVNPSQLNLQQQPQQQLFIQQQQQIQNPSMGNPQRWQNPSMVVQHQNQAQPQVSIQQQQPQQSHPVSSASSSVGSSAQSYLNAPTNSTIIAHLNNPIPSANPALTSHVNTIPQMSQGTNQNQKERHTIWTGSLEWHEKQKGPPDGQKIPRQVPCSVSSSVVNGEPEVKGDGWPPKLIMQLIPKAIVGSLGGTYFREVKTVLFQLQQCEQLQSLTKVMDSGFAGCVHFTGTGMQPSSCTIKVLILLYSKERHAYLGFIPNDQAGFVDRIRKVIQQQKNQQAVMRQGFPGGPNSLPAQSQGIASAAPNQMGMNIGNPAPGSMPALAQQLVQNQPNMGGNVLVQQLNQSQQQQQINPQLQQMGQGIQPSSGIPGQQHSSVVDSSSSQVNQELYEVERQQNLLKIQQLQQTLQQAQQRELQYQQQLHNTQPPLPNQVSVQNSMGGGITQPPIQQIQGIHRTLMNPQNPQMRMLRPNAVPQGNNPGLRHLLQQQQAGPSYRIQNIPVQNMQRMGAAPNVNQMQGNMPQGNPQQVNQFSEDLGILDLLKS